MRSRRGSSPSVVVMSCLALACAASSGRAPLASLPAGASEGREPVIYREAPPRDEVTAVREPSEGGLVAAVADEPRPFRLELERDDGVLSQAPPAPDPGRYRRWRELARIKVGHGHIENAETSADERFVIVRSSEEGTVRVYERGDRRQVGNFAVDGFSAGSFARGEVTRWPGRERGPAFLVGNSRGLVLYSLLDGSRLERLADLDVWDLRWSADARYLVCGASDIATQTSVLTIFRREETGALIAVATIPTAERVDAVALSRDNRLLAMVHYPSDSLELVDLSTGETRWRVAAPRYTSSVDFAPDGSRVAVGGERVVVHEVSDPARTSTYSKLGNNVHRVRFSPSGDAIAVSSYDGHLRILSSQVTGGDLALLEDLRHGGNANVYALTFLGDGSGIISSSGDKTVRFWGR